MVLVILPWTPSMLPPDELLDLVLIWVILPNPKKKYVGHPHQWPFLLIKKWYAGIV